MVEPHCGTDRARFRLDGPVLWMDSKTALALSMALHELCTNAAKYGAFSVQTGEVTVSWRVERSGGQPRLHFVWQERGGPRVEPPTRRGFGSKLIQRGLATELEAEVTLAFEPKGVVCTIVAPWSEGTVR